MQIFRNFKKLFGLFNKREKRNSVIMLGLIAIGGALETLGIGVILPFTAVLLDQNSVDKYPILKTLTEVSWIGGYRRFIVLMCIGLVLTFILKSLYMFFLIYIQNRFTLNRQIDMSKRLFQSYIYKPYEYFFGKNTAEVQRNVNGLVPSVVSGMLMVGLMLLTELMVIAFILILLLIVDPVSSVSLIVVLGGVAAIFYAAIKNRLDGAAKEQNAFRTGMIKSVNEGTGGIKDIKILVRENNFLSAFEKNGRGYAKTAAFYNLVSQSPRLLIETIAISGLVIIVVINALRNPDMNASLPTIAMFGMAAIRIIPSMNRIINHMTSIRFNTVHFNAIYSDLMEAKQAGTKIDADSTAEKMRFGEKIEIAGVTYRYPGTDKIILENVDLTIEKGQAVGIIGSSGAGKTTLVDIMLGLLVPEKGGIFVDGTDIRESMTGWRKNIGYVPQNIFIIDGTVTANVAFGVPDEEIDTERVWAALGTANLKEFVESLDENVDTRVGEKGVRLSGGQRQRLGIARALYHDPEVLVFDEATSSLDMENEKVISEAITKIGRTKTMIIIAHRVNTLEKCDVVYEIKNKTPHRKARL